MTPSTEAYLRAVAARLPSDDAEAFIRGALAAIENATATATDGSAGRPR